MTPEQVWRTVLSRALVLDPCDLREVAGLLDAYQRHKALFDWLVLGLTAEDEPFVETIRAVNGENALHVAQRSHPGLRVVGCFSARDLLRQAAQLQQSGLPRLPRR